MDKMLNSKNEKDSIYEIYRACRLCGGGAGYKMPIIQSIVELDGTDVELKQKIRDCVQIEVTQDDKMPPLICELCVDKVNDFYEFLEMCRQTNTRTRLRLGLPPQALARGTADAGDCILGLTEPVFVEDSDAELDSKNKKAGSKAKGKKDPVVKIKVENLQERRSSQSKKREPTPPRTTRNKSKEELPQKNLKKNKESTPPRITRNSIRDDDEPLNSLKDSLKPSKAAPKSILKKESSFKKEEQREERASRQKKKETTPVRITRSSRDDDLPLNNLKSDEKSKLKRSLEKEVKTETPPKKVKIALKPMTSPVQKTSKSSSDTSHKSGLKNSPGPRSKTRPTRSSDPVPEKKPSAVVREPSPIPEVVCDICQQSFKTIQGRSYHWKTHTVGFTDPKLACNPCGEWFPTQKEAVAHHDFFHITTPYSCENCYSDFKTLTGFDDHLKNNECIPMYVAPDVKCDVCWEMFPTYTMLYSHDCPGEEHRPGGKCAKCNRSYALYKNLVKHESSCTARKKGELIVDQSILDKLKPVQISLQRCDNLVPNKEQYKPTYKGSDDYDSDDRYHPYRSQCRLKAGFRGMVKIHDEIKKVLCSQDYVHWDSAGSDEDDVDKSNSTSNSVHSLVALTLKTIFSQRLVGRVPRRKRRVKIDKVFDSLQADDDDLKVDISNIINKLCEDDEEDMSGKNDDNNVSEKYNDKNSFDDVKNSIDSNNTKDNAKSLSENDDSVNDIDNNDLTLKKTDDNDSLKTLSVNDKQNLHTNDTVSEKDSQDYDKINNDSKESQLMNQLNSDVDGKCENDVNHKGKSELVRSNDFDDSLSNNDNINTNDKDSIDDILPKTLESKTSLGINDFSFDTI